MKLYLIVRLQSWSLGNVEYPFIIIIFGLLLPGVVIPVRVSFISQIELFNLLKMIITYLKPYSCMQNIRVR